MYSILIYDIILRVIYPCVFFFQAEDGIRDLVRSRGLGDVYKRQVSFSGKTKGVIAEASIPKYQPGQEIYVKYDLYDNCLLYTSDAADERSSVDLGGRRIIKKKNTIDDSGAGDFNIKEI